MDTVKVFSLAGVIECPQITQRGVWAVADCGEGACAIIHTPSGTCPHPLLSEMSSDDATLLCKLLGEHYSNLFADAPFGTHDFYAALCKKPPKALGELISGFLQERAALQPDPIVVLVLDIQQAEAPRTEPSDASN